MMEIEGKDSSGARGRLSDNFDHFRSMQMHFFREVCAVTIPPHSDDPIDLAVHAGRMHKVRGSAGTASTCDGERGPKVLTDSVCLLREQFLSAMAVRGSSRSGSRSDLSRVNQGVMTDRGVDVGAQSDAVPIDDFPCCGCVTQCATFPVASDAAPTISNRLVLTASLT